MSPTSYQTAPPRSLIIPRRELLVKPALCRRIAQVCVFAETLLGIHHGHCGNSRVILGLPESALQGNDVESLAGSDTLAAWARIAATRNQTILRVVWARYSEIAFIIPAAVVVGLLIGKLLDYWLHTHWLFLAGIIFGAVIGFVQMIRTVTRAQD